MHLNAGLEGTVVHTVHFNQLEVVRIALHSAQLQSGHEPLMGETGGPSSPWLHIHPGDSEDFPPRR